MVMNEGGLFYRRTGKKVRTVDLDELELAVAIASRAETLLQVTCIVTPLNESRHVCVCMCVCTCCVQSKLAAHATFKAIKDAGGSVGEIPPEYGKSEEDIREACRVEAEAEIMRASAPLATTVLNKVATSGYDALSVSKNVVNQSQVRGSLLLLRQSISSPWVRFVCVSCQEVLRPHADAIITPEMYKKTMTTTTATTGGSGERRRDESEELTAASEEEAAAVELPVVDVDVVPQGAMLGGDGDEDGDGDGVAGSSEIELLEESMWLYQHFTCLARSLAEPEYNDLTFSEVHVLRNKHGQRVGYRGHVANGETYVCLNKHSPDGTNEGRCHNTAGIFIEVMRDKRSVRLGPNGTPSPYDIHIMAAELVQARLRTANHFLMTLMCVRMRTM